jgi:uncharacterized membrane protein YoaK (UPF0700 family)
MIEARPLQRRPEPMPTETDPPEFGFPIVWILAAIAGSVDTCTVAVLKDLHLPFMTGNTTALGQALAGGDWGRAGLVTGIILTFMAGVVGGTVLASVAGVYRLPAVTFAVGIILALSSPFSGPSIPALSFAMGALNEAVRQIGGTSISITYLTGTLIRLGRGIGLLLCGDTGHLRWAEPATLWSALLLGAAATATLQSTHPTAIRAALPIALLAVSSTTFATVRRAGRYSAKEEAGGV